jgi:large subunit ribosomal protein LP1
MASNDELACIYAALILHDDGISITADKIATILKAAGVSVEPYWPTLFAKALDGIDVGSLLGNLGAAASTVGAGVAVGGGGAGVAAAAPAAEEEKEEVKEEKKEESDEESDEDMGFSLFD